MEPFHSIRLPDGGKEGSNLPEMHPGPHPRIPQPPPQKPRPQPESHPKRPHPPPHPKSPQLWLPQPVVHPPPPPPLEYVTVGGGGLTGINELVAWGWIVITCEDDGKTGVTGVVDAGEELTAMPYKLIPPKTRFASLTIVFTDPKICARRPDGRIPLNKLRLGDSIC
jgi:hypothetical protein